MHPVFIESLLTATITKHMVYWSLNIYQLCFHSSLPQQLKGACEALPVVPGQHPLWPQSKDQACCFSGFLYQVAASIYLSPNCRLYDTICISHTDLENIACLANSVSSGGTVTICPVRVSLAHLGSSGSTAFFLCTEKNARVIACLLRFWDIQIQKEAVFSQTVQVFSTLSCNIQGDCWRNTWETSTVEICLILIHVLKNCINIIIQKCENGSFFQTYVQPWIQDSEEN